MRWLFVGLSIWALTLVGIIVAMKIRPQGSSAQLLALLVVSSIVVTVGLGVSGWRTWRLAVGIVSAVAVLVVVYGIGLVLQVSGP